ncbi:MAG: glycosyl transferase [Thermomicrobiales bacterium]|nr:MAG: glycosyl transferase [Thermomicrobiales bacterium]
MFSLSTWQGSSEDDALRTTEHKSVCANALPDYDNETGDALPRLGTKLMRRFVIVFGAAQAVLALRVVGRWVRTARGRPIPRDDGTMEPGQVSVLVPVLNEERRLEPCLAGLVAQGAEVAEILVIDGGSTDGTRNIVRRYASRDRRVRLIDATPVPSEVNGKAFGLAAGVRHADPATAWILTVDADVRPEQGLVRSLLAHAQRERLCVLSVATRQILSGPAEAIIHPAMLATLVYRFGIPGYATADPARVQANGQCLLVRRTALEAIGGFSAVLDSICEDVTLARALALSGCRVGFFEADGLVSTQMYESWREAWTNWSRSLPLRDRFSGRKALIGLVEVTVVQALPLWLVPVLARTLGRRHPMTMLNAGLLAARFGVLAGTARAYLAPPVTYWLSPLCDLPVAVRLWWMIFRRRHTWRGRTIETGGRFG